MSFLEPQFKVNKCKHKLIIVVYNISVVGSKVTQSLRYFFVDETSTDVKTFFLVCTDFFRGK